MKASEMCDDHVNVMATIEFCGGIQPGVLPTKWAMDFCGDRDIAQKLVIDIANLWTLDNQLKFRDFLLGESYTTQPEFARVLLKSPREIVVAALKADGRIESEWLTTNLLFSWMVAEGDTCYQNGSSREDALWAAREQLKEGWLDNKAWDGEPINLGDSCEENVLTYKVVHPLDLKYTNLQKYVLEMFEGIENRLNETDCRSGLMKNDDEPPFEYGDLHVKALTEIINDYLQRECHFYSFGVIDEEKHTVTLTVEQEDLKETNE